MQSSNHALSRVLTIVLVVAVLVAIGQQIYISNAQGEIERANGQLSSLQAQVSTAQTDNATLKTGYGTQFLKWRNAQGRMSFLGDGSGKVCYLTFDDGPDDALTPKNLGILKEKGVVATWFCLADTKGCPYLNLNLCKEIEAQGSAVGIHDWDQNDSYDYYRGSVQNYFDTDFNKTKAAIEGVVGHEVKICRFAGGSSTIGYYNSSIGKKLPRTLLKDGYQFFDWNVLGGDSEPDQMVNGKTPTATIIDNVLGQAKIFANTNSPICVLLHDNPGKDTTTEALPSIIDGLRTLGYTFKTLTYDTPGFYQTVVS